MIPLFAATASTLPLVASLPGIRATRDRSEFERCLTAVSVGVVWCPPTPDKDFIAWLGRLAAAHPTRAIICILRLRAETARLAAQLPCREIVWADEVPDLLMERVRQLSRLDPNSALMRFSEAVASLPPPCREALLRVSDPGMNPIRTASELVGLLGRSETTARRVWRDTLGGVPPKLIVDWILLLRALALAQAGERVLGVAIDLNVHERTLDRVTRRLVGMSFVSAIESPQQDDVVTSFLGFVDSLVKAAA